MREVKLVCPCGQIFFREAYRASRSRTCSKACQYKYARRPSGLTYQIKVKNRAWFKPGEPPIFRHPKGFIPASMVPKKGEHRSRATEFKKGQIPHNFKGDAVGYHALHAWLYRHYGKPECCEQCKSARNIRWASRNWNYSRAREDWWALCQSCHTRYDMQHAWGLATQLYPEIRR